MALLHRLFRFWHRRLETVRQVESAECGLACVAMLSAYHGRGGSLADLRQRLGTSMLGNSLRDVQQFAHEAGLESRALRVSLDRLAELRLPAILHWQFDHFVVLERVTRQGAVLHDPAQGRRKVAWDEVSDCFTGIALEVLPGQELRPAPEAPRVSLRQLLPKVRGWKSSLAHIVVLTLTIQLFGLASPIFLQVAIDEVGSNRDASLLTVMALGFGALLLLQTVFTYARGRASLYVSTLMNYQMRANLFRHLLSLPLGYFHKRSLGDVISRFLDISNINEALTGQAITAIADGVIVLPLLLLMASYSPLMAAVFLFSTLCYTGLRLWHLANLARARRDAIGSASRENGFLIETVRSMQTLKLYHHQGVRAAQYNNTMAESFNDNARVGAFENLRSTLDTAWFGAEQLVLCVLGIHALLAGDLTPGMLFAFLAARTQMAQLLRGIVDTVVQLRGLRLHAERLADIALTEPDPVDVDRSGGLLTAPRGLLEVRELAYRHEGSQAPLFQGVNFIIHPGESVAIIGPSGCGKTTLVKLLTGLLTPSAGAVLLDGQPLTAERVRWLRANAGTVMQDDTLLSGTLAENIAMFADSIDLDRMAEVCRTAAILDDIQVLPMGFHTRLGDTGGFLSGGQRQRLLLARALYKAPKILVLDEATSQLDAATERLVNEAIQRLGITRIMVAHKPETIRSAYRVIDLAPHCGPTAALRRQGPTMVVT